MGVFPAFFTLYVTKERRSSVQAMQLSNGIANPASLWLGHLLFDGMFGVVVAIIIAVVFSKVSTQFSYLGLYVSTLSVQSPYFLRPLQGFTMVLYGYTSILFAYCVTLFSASALAAFSIVAGYQVIMFMLYVSISHGLPHILTPFQLSAYLLTLTYAPVSETSRYMTIIRKDNG